MLIENPDALKDWLKSTLEKLCEADPIALSKYVVALIKKEKPVEELKESLQEQMEVFLQSETKDFVLLLFDTLDTKAYLKAKAVKKDDSLADTEATSKEDLIEGKPDSTTVVSKSGEPGSPLKDSSNKLGKRVFEEEPRGGRGRRSPVRRREGSPTAGAGRHRRSPVGGRRFRSRSRSPVFRRGASPPFSRRRRSSPYRRSRSRSYSPPTIGAKKFLSRGSTPTKDEETPGYTPTARGLERRPPRCRDYDEKGFCMKGDQCTFDHGSDALVLEDANAAAGIVPYQPAAMPAPAMYPEPYIPAASLSLPLPPFNVPPPGYPPEVVGLNRKRPLQEMPTEAGGYPPQKRFDYSRLGRGGRGGRGGRSGGASGSFTCQLAVRNIPPAFNTIAHLNNHFARFGALTNVQVHFEGDPASAMVTFSSPTEAEMAMNSSEAVMGNRFIKVFYHTEPKMTPGNVKDRVGAKPKVTVDGSNIIKTIVNEEASPKQKAAAQASKDEMKAAENAAIKKGQEALEAQAKQKRTSTENAREKVTNLIKGKQDLLDKLIAEQKNLLAKLEEKKATLKPEEKTMIMTLIKSTSASIDSARDDIKKLVQSLNRRRTISDVQKELLDAELELFNAQQSGNETTDIQARVNQLRVEAAKAGVLPTSKSPRGRGISGPFFASRGAPRFQRGRGFLRRGRYSSPGVTHLDRRPAKLLISGYEIDDKESLMEHFRQFGEIVDTIEDELTPSVIVHYKTRQFAEAAMAGGKVYGDRVLQLSWYTGATPSDFNPELSHEETADVTTELDDDYTPLDPAYLPPGLEEEGGSAGGEEADDSKGEVATSKDLTADALDQTETEAALGNDSNDEFGNEDLTEDLLAEDDEEEEGGERSWKR